MNCPHCEASLTEHEMPEHPIYDPKTDCPLIGAKMSRKAWKFIGAREWQRASAKKALEQITTLMSQKKHPNKDQLEAAFSEGFAALALMELSDGQ
jgi:hypothetical protein